MTTMKLCKNVVIPLLQSFHSRPLLSPSPTLHWPFLLCLLTKKRKSHRGGERRERRESTRTIQSFWPRATAGCFSFLPCFCTAFYPAFLSPHSLYVSPHLTLSPSHSLSIYLYCVLGEHETFCLFPQMQFAAARCPFRKFLLRLLYRLCHFQLILHYIKHGLLQ